MTLWAVLSDVHGRGDRLSRALSDIKAQRAERILALGDVGSITALATLDHADALCAFGNWEASGLRAPRTLPELGGTLARVPIVGWVLGWHAGLVWPGWPGSAA
jgi:predicted phosphodiesterase